MARIRHRMLAAGILIAAIAAGATTASSLTPSASVTTAIQGWEHWLRLEWTATARANGQAIDGYVYNKRGSPVADVQLLAQGLDGAGKVVDQKIEWVPGMVPGLQRAYFRIPAMRQAERYQVTVWAFNIIEGKTYD
jgi:ABC-type proline/glycine betaine transport system substrate-binding protein